MIKKGWKIIKKKDFVSRENYEKLEAMRKEMKVSEIFGKEPSLSYDEWLKTKDAESELYFF